MKGRESGMPPKEMWEGFFDPPRILDILQMEKHDGDVAEFGCGYGTFTIPAAKIVRGTVYAVDIETDMVRATETEARREGLKNVKTVLRDFMVEGTGLKDGSVDYVMLFNILHITNPQTLLKEAWRILRPDRKTGIIHWNYDASTPRGPSMEIRPMPSDCIRWAKQAGFVKLEQHDLKPYHYGIVLKKK